MYDTNSKRESMIFCKKKKILKFSIFFSKGGTLWCRNRQKKNFPFFKNFNSILDGLWNYVTGRGGGHYGPDDRERPRWFRRVRATTTKIPDFVSVYVWMVPWKSFLGFVFKIFEKRKKFFLTISTSKGPPFGKKSKISKKIFFLEKIILFLFEFVLYMF